MNVAITIGLVAFSATTLGIGLYASRLVRHKSENYIVAGRHLVLFLASGALMAQAIDGNATLGNTTLTHQFGFWYGASLPIGLGLCLLVVGLFFAAPMHRLRLLTLPDFYFRAFGKPTEKVASVIMIVSFSILLAGNLAACGFIAQAFMGLSYGWGVGLAALVIFAYTVTGGLISSAYTDIFLVIVAAAGAAAGLVFVALKFGTSIPDGMGPFDGAQMFDFSQGAAINWATLLVLGLGDVVAIDFMERVFAARSPETARKACFIGAAGTILIGIPYSLMALYAFGKINVAAGNPALFVLIQEHLPLFVGILILGSVAAASFSTANGAILAMSTVLAHNILGIGRHPEKEDEDRALLRMSRLIAIPVTLFGIFFAIRMPEPGILLTLAFDLVFAGALVPLVMGLFWKRDTAAALASLILATALRLVFFVLTPTCYGVPNQLLYFENTTIFAQTHGPEGVAILDGWISLVPPLFSLLLYVIMAGPSQRGEGPGFFIKQEASQGDR